MRKYKWMKYCPEHYMEIENYDLALADNFKGWVCHHRNGLEFSREWLIKNNMYFNRKDPHEFKFMKCEDHSLLHGNIAGKFKGHHHTAETRARISANNAHYSPSGRTPWNKGMKTAPKWFKAKKWTLSEETKRKHSEAMKAAWAKRKEKQHALANMEESK